MELLTFEQPTQNAPDQDYGRQDQYDVQGAKPRSRDMASEKEASEAQHCYCEGGVLVADPRDMPGHRFAPARNAPAEAGAGTEDVSAVDRLVGCGSRALDIAALAGWAEYVGALVFQEPRDAPVFPVLDALGAALLEAKTASKGSWAAQGVDQRSVSMEGDHAQ